MNKVKTNSILHHTKQAEINKPELIKSITDLGGNIYGFQNFVQAKIAKHGAVIGLQSIKDCWTKDTRIVGGWLFMIECYKEHLITQKQGKTNE